MGKRHSKYGSGGGDWGVELVKLSYSFLSPESVLCVVKYCHAGCCNNMPWLEDETIVPYPTLPYPAACTDIAATAFRRTKTEISSISGIVKFTAKRVQFKFAKVLVHLERFFFKFIHVSYRYSCTSVYKCVAICSNPSCARWCLIFLHRTVPREQNLLKTHLTPLYCRFFSP